jgi:hypothetical protein
MADDANLQPNTDEAYTFDETDIVDDDPRNPARAPNGRISPHDWIALALAAAGIVLICTTALAWLGIALLLIGLAYAATARWFIHQQTGG